MLLFRFCRLALSSGELSLIGLSLLRWLMRFAISGVYAGLYCFLYPFGMNCLLALFMVFVKALLAWCTEGNEFISRFCVCCSMYSVNLGQFAFL